MANRLQVLKATLTEEEVRLRAKNAKERAAKEKDRDSYARLVRRINTASDREIERALAAH